MLTVANVSGQILINYSPSEIRNIVKPDEWGYEKYGDNNELLVMVAKQEAMTQLYFFGENNLSTCYVVIPHSQMMLQAIVELYNARYVKIDDNNWKLYIQDAVLKCELTFDGSYHKFFWSR